MVVMRVILIRKPSQTFKTPDSDTEGVDLKIRADCGMVPNADCAQACGREGRCHDSEPVLSQAVPRQGLIRNSG